MHFTIRSEATRFLKLGIIGFGNFLLGLVLLNVFYALTGKLIFSSTVSFIVTVISGFVFNRIWTFRDKRGENLRRQALKFGLVNLVGYGINFASYNFFFAFVCAWSAGTFNTNIFGYTLYSIASGHAPHFSMLLIDASAVFATGVTVSVTYVAHRLWSFRA